MQISARQFTTSGLEQLREIFAEARLGLKSTQAAKIDEAALDKINDLVFNDELTSKIPSKSAWGTLTKWL